MCILAYDISWCEMFVLKISGIQMNIVLSKNGVKWVVLKISDVQKV